MQEQLKGSTGIDLLDRLLNGLYIGDNVVWHDSSGSLAHIFCMNLIQSSAKLGKEIIYVSFDRSPRNLLEKLGPLARNDSFTILDCFTCGKGGGTSVFQKFYDQPEQTLPCRIIRVEKPRDVNSFMDELYGLHAIMQGDVRLVFESITGMQELWGGEDQILSFYVHSCPRLYELKTIAYWIMERGAHTSRLRAGINQIAQVVIDLAIKRGTTSITILKAEKRDFSTMHKPYVYWTRGNDVYIDTDRKLAGIIDLGIRLKDLRTKRGFSQSELAKRVGVTPSTISQVESNLIYPSLPALLKMAEILGASVSSFFYEHEEEEQPFFFPAATATKVKLPDLDEESVVAKMLTPLDFNIKIEPYLIEIPPGNVISSHFMIHKGEEFGYLLSGKLHVKIKQGVYTAKEGDVVYLKSEIPSQWENPGPDPTRILWIKIK